MSRSVTIPTGVRGPSKSSVTTTSQALCSRISLAASDRSPARSNDHFSSTNVTNKQLVFFSFPGISI